MAPQQMTGENFENKSQSNDVRRNNIIAAKGDDCPFAPRCRARPPLSPRGGSLRTWDTRWGGMA